MILSLLPDIFYCFCLQQWHCKSCKYLNTKQKDALIEQFVASYSIFNFYRSGNINMNIIFLACQLGFVHGLVGQHTHRWNVVIRYMHAHTNAVCAGIITMCVSLSESPFVWRSLWVNEFWKLISMITFKLSDNRQWKEPWWIHRSVYRINNAVRINYQYSARSRE